MPPCHYTYPHEPSRRHTPFACRQQQPTGDQMIASYHLFITDPAIVSTVYHEVNETSPLNLNPLLSPACTILNEIAYEQVPLLLRLFDILGGADLIYNIRQYPTLITPPPPGSRRPSIATSPPVSSKSSSPLASSPSSSRSSHSSCSLRRADRPHACCLSGPNPQPCKSHDSLSEVDPETAFGISRAKLDYTLNIIETLAQLPPSPVLNALAKADHPLTPSNPCYCQACYICHHLGYIHVNCGLYKCPLCHATRPGHTQAQCPSIHPHCPLQERITTPGVVDDRTPIVGSEDNDLYNNDFDFNDSTISNMTREPYGEWLKHQTWTKRGNTRNSGNSRDAAYSAKDGKKSTCEKCGKEGHMKDQCWEEGGRKAGQAPKWFQNKGKGKKKEKGTGKAATAASTSASSSVQTSTDSDPDRVWLAHLQDNNWLMEIAEEEILKPQDIINDEEDVYMDNYNHVLLAGENLNSTEETILFNSGTSCHMSSYCSEFLNYKPIIPKPITAADNHTFHAIGKGDLAILLPNGTTQTHI
ncbi:hypothetical protein M404DRAFT_34692 [Pisolithus tinctorius Marx 270]|uniref:CCHC-type domain-containing protein n=1 Tax=Pisolithus tinctorius Marx 270 TaxID=870435 RepID=A0A0C3NH60_PISTI|nr:hypothetical protein M404DRAFT_34692 [Pisolithus tinctorius Marx 270]